MVLEEKNSKKRIWIRLLVGGMLILSALIVFKFTLIADYLKIDNLRLLQK